jgi:thiol:disulfide interchange protein DsbD
VLTGILAWIAQTKSAGLGAMAMAAFALGLGVPFFVVGAFAVQLPKSGRWMVHVKSLLGIVLVVVALYFLSGVFPVLGAFVHPGTVLWVAAGVAVVAGVLLGAVHREFSDPVVGVKVARAPGSC